MAVELLRDSGSSKPFKTVLSHDSGTFKPFKTALSCDNGSFKPFKTALSCDSGSFEPFGTVLSHDSELFKPFGCRNGGRKRYVIARSGATKQSMSCFGLLHSVRNDGERMS
jgi:hypothetical protein